MIAASRLVGPDGLILDLHQRHASVQDNPVDLARREFDLLAVLVRDQGRVVPLDEIAERAWGHPPDGDHRFIYTSAWRLRRALESAGAGHIFETVRGVGYSIRGVGGVAPGRLLSDAGLQLQHFRKRTGARIAYAARGSGPPILVIPPLNRYIEFSQTLLAPLTDPLLPDHQLLHYDKQGSGHSDHHLDDWRFERHTEELIELLDHLQFERTAVVAPASGGPIAVHLAANHPERISRIVFVSTYASGPDLFAPDVRDAMLTMIRASRSIASRSLADLRARRGWPITASELDQYQRDTLDNDHAQRLLKEGYDTNVTDLLPRVRAESLILHHREDHAIPFGGARQLASGLPRARLIPLEGEGHIYVDPSRDPAVIEHVAHFLRRDEPR